MDGCAAHTTRVWTVPANGRDSAPAHSLPTALPYGPDAPLRGLPKIEIRRDKKRAWLTKVGPRPDFAFPAMYASQEMLISNVQAI